MSTLSTIGTAQDSRRSPTRGTETLGRPHVENIPLHPTGLKERLFSSVDTTPTGKTTNISSTLARKGTGDCDAQEFLASAGVARTIVQYRGSQKIYLQGESAKGVLYIQKGGVKLSVVSAVGKEAIVALLGPGDFVGEGCLTGLPFRMETATAITTASILLIETNEMLRVLHEEYKFSDRFIAYLLTRNIRVEEDLIDQLFNSIEKRLARALLLLAPYGRQGQADKMLPKVSQEMLAAMVGTTRSRVNVFMTKFRKLGFIHYDGGLHINKSLLSVVLQD